LKIFTQKWASVDMNWGGGDSPPDNSNPSIYSILRRDNQNFDDFQWIFIQVYT